MFVGHLSIGFAAKRIAPELSSRVFGMGLWDSLPATLVVEGGMWIAAGESGG
jgi:hypothetical protein